MQIPISNYERDTEHETDIDLMGMDISFGPWAKCWTFPWRRNAAHGLRKRMNLFTSLKFCLRLECRTILAMKLTNMQKQDYTET